MQLPDEASVVVLHWSGITWSTKHSEGPLHSGRCVKPLVAPRGPNWSRGFNWKLARVNCLAWGLGASIGSCIWGWGARANAGPKAGGIGALCGLASSGYCKVPELRRYFERFHSSQLSIKAPSNPISACSDWNRHHVAEGLLRAPSRFQASASLPLPAWLDLALPVALGLAGASSLHFPDSPPSGVPTLFRRLRCRQAALHRFPRGLRWSAWAGWRPSLPSSLHRLVPLMFEKLQPKAPQGSYKIYMQDP